MILSYRHYIKPKEFKLHVQSHSYIRHGNRRLSLAALVYLLANNHSVIPVHFPSRWSRASTYICKAKTLAFTDCDYCYSALSVVIVIIVICDMPRQEFSLCERVYIQNT